MAGSGKLVAGSIMIVVAAILIVFAAIAAVTYADFPNVQENNKKARDLRILMGQDASDINKTIAENEDLARTKVQSMSICFPVGFILLVVGAFLIVKWNREKRLVPPGGSAATGQSPQGQYPGQPPAQVQQDQPRYDDQNLYGKDYQQRQPPAQPPSAP